MPYKNPEDKKVWTDKENKRRTLTGYYREYKRKHYVGDFRVEGKREYTGYCEVCGRKLKDKRGNHAYHHWDDEIREAGMYLCCTCHNMAEAIDKDLDVVYLRLKAKIMLDRVGIRLEDYDG